MRATTFILAMCAAAMVAVADVVPTVQWDVETGRLAPVPYTLSIRRGESANLQPRFLSYNSPMVLTGATVQLRYWYTGQAGYYATTGSLMAATGRVQIAWYDALCPASNALNYEVRCTIGTNVLARAYGPLNLLTGTSGTETNGQVRTSLDWGLLDQTGGTAVLSNQMGSGATWNGSAWTFAAAGTMDHGALTNLNGDVDYQHISTARVAAIDAAYPSSNPSNYLTESTSLGVTNVTGGILQLIGRQVSLVTSNLTAVLDSVYAALVHDHDYRVITNEPWANQSDYLVTSNQAAGGVATNDARYLASITNAVMTTNSAGIVTRPDAFTVGVGTAVVQGVTGAITNNQTGVILGLATNTGAMVINGNADTPQLTAKGNATQTAPILRTVLSDGTTVKFSTDNSGNVYAAGVMSNAGVYAAGALNVTGTATLTNVVTTGFLVNQGVTNLNSALFPVTALGGATTQTLNYAVNEQQILMTNNTFITASALPSAGGITMGLFIDPTTNNYTVTWDTNVFNVGSAGWPVIGTNGADLVLRKCYGSTMWTVNGPTAGWNGSITNLFGTSTNITVVVGGLITTNIFYP